MFVMRGSFGLWTHFVRARMWSGVSGIKFQVKLADVDIAWCAMCFYSVGKRGIRLHLSRHDVCTAAFTMNIIASHQHRHRHCWQRACCFPSTAKQCGFISCIRMSECTYVSPLTRFSRTSIKSVFGFNSPTKVTKPYVRTYRRWPKWKVLANASVRIRWLIEQLSMSIKQRWRCREVKTKQNQGTYIRNVTLRPCFSVTANAVYSIRI